MALDWEVQGGGSKYTKCTALLAKVRMQKTFHPGAWPDGSRALAFDLLDFAAFELHLLQRPGAHRLRADQTPSLA